MLFRQDSDWRSEDPGSPISSAPPASYRKPLLGAQPAEVVAPGVNVTLKCLAPQPAWKFVLFKSGEIPQVLEQNVSVELAEFFLEEVTPAQGGSYHCCYQRPGWELGVWSPPSNTVELLVTGEVLRARKERGHRGGRGVGGTEGHRERYTQTGTATQKKRFTERERMNQRSRCESPRAHRAHEVISSNISRHFWLSQLRKGCWHPIGTGQRS